MTRRACARRAAWAPAALIMALAVATGARASDHDPGTARITHDATIRHDPETGRTEIGDTITVEGRSEIRLALAPWLIPSALLLDGETRPLPPAGGGLRLSLPDRGAHTVTLRAAGVPPPIDPQRSETAARAGFGTEGSYFPASAMWLPLTGDDWIAYRLAVSVPAPYRAVATGRLVDESEEDGHAIARFEAPFPVEPPSLFVGPYVVDERVTGGLRIRTYFHSDVAPLAAAYLDDAARYIALYSERIGPYPFDDFHIVAAPLPVGLGFPNLTYIGRRILPLPFIRARSLAHEVLHNWWGNGVAVDYGGGNWSEGLTTYMADYALGAEGDPARAREMRLGWLRDYAALPASRDAPLARFVARHNDAAQVVGYNKAAFLFHMLRRHLGDAAFDAALRLFWTRAQFRIAGWDTLQAAFEEAGGQPLDWFFRQWLTRAGAPRITLVDAGVSRASDGYRVSLTLAQDGPAYRLGVPVRIETESGVHESQVVLDGVETIVSVVVPARPRAVRVDPDHDVFRRLLPGEAPPILRDVTLAAADVVMAAGGDAAPVARRLVSRLLDRLDRHDARADGERAPRLVIATAETIARTLTEAGLPPPPASLAGRGTARVWTGHTADGRPALVVDADDAAALRALLRPLPHYGAKSYLVFDGARVIESGVWPASASPLSRALD